jgi:subtilisin
VSDAELPAWSEPFADTDPLRLYRPTRMPGITRRWAWGGSTGKGVRVGIIDSGLETDHPALQGRVVQSVAFEMVDGEPKLIENDTAGDLYGHGTACGDIILRLAPEVELVSIRVLGEDLRGKGSAFIAGLEWAIEQRLPVCNLSLSSKSDALFPIFHEVADEAYFRRICLVSAANNVPAPSYPSLFSSVISVAAHAWPDPERIYYNPDPPVEFGAWGVDVPMAWKGGGSITATGNSFAAPHIAALVARIVAKHPGISPFEVKAVLAGVADNPRRRSARHRPAADAAAG